MIVMNYKDLDKRELFTALEKIRDSNSTFHVAYNTGRVLAAIETKIAELKIGYMDLMKKHAELDEAGKPKVDPANPKLWLVAADKKEVFEADEQELFKGSFEIDRHKLKASSIPDVKFTPEEALALEIIMEEENG